MGKVMNLIRLALLIATTAHYNQYDKAYKPYIEHPIRVANKFTDDTDIAVALLHDVVEDTGLSFQDLAYLRIPDEVITAVAAITKHHGEIQTDYLRRVKSNPVALKVKLADIEDNTAPNRMILLNKKTRKRLRAKYELEKKILLS